jgi:hypothetical protein
MAQEGRGTRRAAAYLPRVGLSCRRGRSIRKYFKDKPPLPAVQRPAAVIAFYPAMRWLRLRLDANQLVLRIAVWTAEQLRM